jgi:ketosteroid isomerase-like protein
MRLRMSVLKTLALALCAAWQPPPNAHAQTAPMMQSRAEKERDVDETLVRQRAEGLAKAVSGKDIDRVMAFYAPDIVSFDINPPLRYAGSDRKRRAWQELFAAYTNLAYAVSELDVTADSDLAFVHSLNKVKGTLANGHATQMWVRWTACFRRIDGVWIIVHDHVSVPADLEQGQALVNLTP